MDYRIVVGAEIVVKNSYGSTRPSQVTSIGRKWFYVRFRGNEKGLAFSTDAEIPCNDKEGYWKLYMSFADIEKENEEYRERGRLVKSLREARDSKLSLDQLRRINAILQEGTARVDS